MKGRLYNIFFVTFAIAGMLLFNSCQHDSCVDLNCQNGGTCIDDHCQCPPGYEGPECRIQSNQRFVGLWVGHSKCEGFPQKVDSVEIFAYCNPNIIKLVTGMGSSSVRQIIGTAVTPEAEFLTFDDGDVHVVPYARVDANQLMVTLISINKRDSLRYMCEFEGRIVPGTDTLEEYKVPIGDCP